jgi:hypothetical protein
MGFDHMDHTWELVLPDELRDVLLIYARRANAEGHAWPGVEAIAHQLGCSERTVIRNVKRLRTMGLLTPVGRTNGGRKPGGAGNTTIYLLTLANCPRKPPLRPGSGEGQRRDDAKRRSKKGDTTVSPFAHSEMGDIQASPIGDNHKGDTTVSPFTHSDRTLVPVSPSSHPSGGDTTMSSIAGKGDSWPREITRSHSELKGEMRSPHVAKGDTRTSPEGHCGRKGEGQEPNGTLANASGHGPLIDQSSPRRQPRPCLGRELTETARAFLLLTWRRLHYQPDGRPPAGYDDAQDATIFDRLVRIHGFTPQQIADAAEGLALMRAAGDLKGVLPATKLTARFLILPRDDRPMVLVTSEYFYARQKREPLTNILQSFATPGDVLERRAK